MFDFYCLISPASHIGKIQTLYRPKNNRDVNENPIDPDDIGTLIAPIVSASRDTIIES